MAECTACSKPGEGGAGWKYGSRTGCIYDNFDDCLRINNPRKAGGFYIPTGSCIVFMNDNAGGNPVIEGDIYGGPSMTRPIPYYGGLGDFYMSNLELDYTSPLTGEPASRLWAYDIVTNQTQFVKSLTHEGSDIATTDNKMWTTCQYNLAKWNYNLPFKGMAILTVNEVDFTMDETKVETFQSTPTKVYRFVDDYGNLLTKTNHAASNYFDCSFSHCGSDLGRGDNHGLGAGLAAINDTHILICDQHGIYIANLEENYTGATVNTWDSHDTQGLKTYPNNPGGPTDLSAHQYDPSIGTTPSTDGLGFADGGRTLEDGWYSCSCDVNHQIHTIVARKVVDLSCYQSPWPYTGPNSAAGRVHERVAGDMSFIPNDPFVISATSGTYKHGIIATLTQRKAGNTFSTERTIKRFAFPLTSLTQDQWFVQSSAYDRATGGDLCNCTGCHVGLGNLVNFTNANMNSWPAPGYKWRYDATYDYGPIQFTRGFPYVPNSPLAVIKDGNGVDYTIGAADYNSPVNFQPRRFTLSNNLTTDLGVPTILELSYFNAASIPTNIQFPSVQAGVPGVQGLAMRGGSQSPECVYPSAFTFDCAVNGCVAVLGDGGAYSSFSACSADCVSFSCVTPCVCPSGYTYDPSIPGCAATTTPVVNPNATQVQKAGILQPYSNEGSRFCLDFECNDWVDRYGPTGGTYVGWFGGGPGVFNGNQSLFNWPLNRTGLWSGLGVQGQNELPLNQWIGTTRCVTISADSVYLMAVAADNYFRVALDNQVMIDTLAVWAPNNSLPAPYDSIMTIPNNFTIPVSSAVYSDNNSPHDNFNKMWVFPVTATTGQHTFLFEGWNAGRNASFGYELVGPFSLDNFSSSTATTNFYSELTAEEYCERTILSSVDLLDVQYTTTPGVGTGPYFLEDQQKDCNIEKPTVPYSLYGTLNSNYGDPYKVIPSDWCPGTINPITGFNVLNGQLPSLANYLRGERIGPLPWFADSATTYNGLPGYTLNFGDFNYLSETTPCSGGAGYGPNETCNSYIDTQSLQTLSDGSTFNNSWPITSPAVEEAQNLGVCLDYSMCSTPACAQWKPSGAITHSLTWFRLTGFDTTMTQNMTHLVPVPGGSPNNGSNPNGNSPKFYKWTDFIDWLNANGLNTSPIDGSNITYNAGFWNVMYAVNAYWEPFQTYLGVQPQVLPAPGDEIIGFETDTMICSCSSTNGYFDTEINECPTGYVWDACEDTCTSIVPCEGGAPLGFSGGCIEIVGTGQTGTFSTLVECERDCVTSSGITYYACTATGCTPSSGVTQYTSKTQCETGYVTSTGVEISGCTSYNCTSTGCTIYNSPNYGTGGTYTTLQNCIAQPCESYNCDNFGCITQIGTGGTYTTYEACTATTACTSYECLSNGCEAYPGTGYTYQYLSACTADCRSWECTVGRCCEVWNYPNYGTGFTDNPYGFMTESACTATCVAWACQENSAITKTDIYNYVHSMYNVDLIIKQITEVNSWVASIPGHSGNTYHILTCDENWLDWGNATYAGTFTAGTLNSVATVSFIGSVLQWWDNWSPNAVPNSAIHTQVTSGLTWPLQTTALSPAGVMSHGPAPAAALSSNTITICSLDESMYDSLMSTSTSNQDGYTPLDINTLQQQPNTFSNQAPIFSSGTLTNGNFYQPGTTWKQHYTAFTNTWNAITGASGTAQFYMNPKYNQNNDGTAANLALNMVAGIDSGNKTVKDGTWIGPNLTHPLGTAPRRPSSGGQYNGIPIACEVGDLMILELTNPYYPTYGALDTKGWVYNVNFENANAGWNNFANTLSNVLSTTYVFTSTTGCFSSCTRPTAAFPHLTEAECLSAGTCAQYDCTNNGCILQTSGQTNGTYATLEACTADCKSYLCVDSGCTIYNPPTTTPIDYSISYGTGGTFTGSFIDQYGFLPCVRDCVSFNCYGPTELTSYLSNGCISLMGTGGTFTEYSACTGDCRSWECSEPCKTGQSGCTEYPHTGATYLTESACTATCVANWWCVPEQYADPCSGVTLVSFNSGIPSNGVQAVNAIADPSNGLQYTNFSTIKYETNQIYSQFITPCMGPNGLPLQVLDKIYVFGQNYFNIPTPANYYNWADFIFDINFFNPTQPPINLSSGYQGVANWQHYNNNGQMTELPGTGFSGISFANHFCECEELPCSVTCTNGPLSGTPSNWTGPYASSGMAYNVCCANTWDCVPAGETNSCSGTTQIPGVYTSSTHAFNWITTNMPNVDITTLSYESNTSPNTVANGCEGPNGGLVLTFDAISYPLLQNGSNYTVWNTFINALQNHGLGTVVSGMSYNVVNSELAIGSGKTLSICNNACLCTENDCYCVEVQGSGGTYATQSLCISACCDPSSGTSWECVNEGPMQPLCNQTPYAGFFGTTWDALDWFQINSPGSIFVSNKFVSLYTAALTPNNWQTFAQVQTAMAGTLYNWSDCFRKVVSGVYLPYETITEISHPLLSGTSLYGGYASYNSFYADVVSAGVTGLAGLSVSGICEQIDAQLNPGGKPFGCDVETRKCCNRAQCYCYELYTTGGTYQTEPLCLSACCPEDGWYCTAPGVCVASAAPPGPPFIWFDPVVWGSSALAQAACLGQSFENCPLMRYECITGATASTCSDALGYINEVSPGTPGNQNGLPFSQAGAPTYPFTANTIYPTAGVPGVTVQQAEEILTTSTYLDINTPFSSVTYELNNPNVTLVNGQCIGPNGYPVFRLISFTNNHTGPTVFYNWSGFCSAVGITSQSPPNAADLSVELGYYKFNVEPCICNEVECYCVEDINGQYATSALCEQYCCVPEESYDCTIYGCVDLGNGTGQFTGLTAWADCIAVCNEYVCHEEGDPDYDSCQNLIPITMPLYYLNNASSTGALLSQFSTPAMQSMDFGDYKFNVFVPATNNPCVGSCCTKEGQWYNLESIYIDNVVAGIVTGAQNTWCDFITALNGTAGVINNFGGNYFNCNDTYSYVKTELVQIQGINTLTASIEENLEPCFCSGKPCDCYQIQGTGHTGAYSSYTSCISGCCDDKIVKDCDIFALGFENFGIHSYNHGTAISQHLFDSVNFDYHDIAVTGNKMWLYNDTTLTLEEYNIQYGVAFGNIWNQTLAQTITLPSPIGKGLEAVNNTTLIGGGSQIYQIDVSVNPAVFVTLGTLPNGGVVTGDILYDPVTNLLLITYTDNTNTRWLSKFTYNIQELEKRDITTYPLQDGLYSYGIGGECSPYSVGQSGLTYEILQNPSYTLDIAPTSLQNLPVQQPGTGIDNGVLGTAINPDCNCISVPVTYDCKIPAGSLQGYCFDPGDGTGPYTNATALANGYLTLGLPDPLLECQENCTSACTSWECEEGTMVNTCDLVQTYLPYPAVGSGVAAIAFIASQSNGLQQTPLHTIGFEGLAPAVIPSGCTGPSGQQLYTITSLSSQSLPASTYNSWYDLLVDLDTLVVEPLWMLLTMTYSQIQQLMSFYFGELGVVRISVKPCLCYEVGCYCYEVNHPNGQYPSQSLCEKKCCDPSEETGYDCKYITGAFPTCVPCVAGAPCQYTTSAAQLLGYAGPDHALNYCQDFCKNDDRPEGGYNCKTGQGCVFTNISPWTYGDLVTCQQNCPQDHYYDCIQGSCVGLLNGVVGPYITYAQCLQQSDCGPEPIDGFDCINGQCVPSPTGQYPTWQQCMLNCTDGPCEPTVSCADGFIWSYVYCRCVCEQNESCEQGFIWSYDTCNCEPNEHESVEFEGQLDQLGVKISEFTNTSLKSVLSELSVADDIIEQQIKGGLKYGTDGELISRCDECGGSDNPIGLCIMGGCLVPQNITRDNTSTYVWTLKEALRGGVSFDCINGVCVNVGPGQGKFDTITECLGKCDSISADGEKQTSVKQDKTPQIEYSQSEVNTITTPTPSGRAIKNYYNCETTVNNLVGQQQKACVPTDTPSAISYDSLEKCLNSGCAGWMSNSTKSTLDICGIQIGAKQVSPIPMCCESYINSTTDNITVQGCDENCYKGEDSWFPLYNIIGPTASVDSPLGYFKTPIVGLINNNLLEVTTSKSILTSEGYAVQEIYRGVEVQPKDGFIIGYDGDQPIFSNIAEALEESTKLGCSGYHKMVMDNGKTGYMACETHQDLHDKLVAADPNRVARQTAGGPCICRKYQTGPDGISKCIEWSPPGCGDAPFYVAPQDRRIDYVSTPATTLDVRNGGGTGRGTTSDMGGDATYENNSDDTRRTEEGRNRDTSSGY